MYIVLAGGDSLETIYDKVGTSLKSDEVYFMFYSAPTIDINSLIEGMCYLLLFILCL